MIHGKESRWPKLDLLLGIFSNSALSIIAGETRQPKTTQNDNKIETDGVFIQRQLASLQYMCQVKINTSIIDLNFFFFFINLHVYPLY